MYLVIEIGIYNGCGEFEFNNNLYEKRFWAVCTACSTRLYFYKDILLYVCILPLDNALGNDLFFHSYTFFVKLHTSHILYNNYYNMPSCIIVWPISNTYCQINVPGGTTAYWHPSIISVIVIIYLIYFIFYIFVIAVRIHFEERRITFYNHCS